MKGDRGAHKGLQSRPMAPHSLPQGWKSEQSMLPKCFNKNSAKARRSPGRAPVGDTDRIWPQAERAARSAPSHLRSKLANSCSFCKKRIEELSARDVQWAPRLRWGRQILTSCGLMPPAPRGHKESQEIVRNHSLSQEFFGRLWLIVA